MNMRYLLPVLLLAGCAHRGPAGRNPSATAMSEIECVPSFRVNRVDALDTGNTDFAHPAVLTKLAKKFPVTAFKSVSVYMDADPKGTRVIFDHVLEDDADCRDIPAADNNGTALRQCETPEFSTLGSKVSHSEFNKYVLNIYTAENKASRLPHGRVDRFPASLQMGENSIYSLSCFNHELASN